MHTVFLCLALITITPTLLEIAFLVYLKHAGNWNDQIRLHEHGIKRFIHPQPPYVALACLFISAIFYITRI